MKTLVLVAVFFTGVSFYSTDDEIIGIWQIKLPNNVVGTINYRKDSSFVTSVNNKNFTSGRYLYKDKVMTLSEDNGCQNKDGGFLVGAYKIAFIMADSIQFELIYDSCGGRKRDLNHMKLGRVEKSTAK